MMQMFFFWIEILCSVCFMQNNKSVVGDSSLEFPWFRIFVQVSAYIVLMGFPKALALAQAKVNEPEDRFQVK